MAPPCLHCLALPVSIGIGSVVLRPLLTSGLPSSACAALFLAFSRRDDLLPGAAQISPDKNIDFLCTSSPFTKSVDRRRLRDVGLTRLTGPAL